MNKYLPYLFYIGTLFILLAGILKGIFRLDNHIMMYGVYYIGAVSLLLYFALSRPEKNATIRQKRLTMMGLFSSLLYMVGGYFLYKTNNLWMLFFIIATIFLCYANIIGIYINNKKNKRQ